MRQNGSGIRGKVFASETEENGTFASIMSPWTRIHPTLFKASLVSQCDKKILVVLRAVTEMNVIANCDLSIEAEGRGTVSPFPTAPPDYRRKQNEGFLLLNISTSNPTSKFNPLVPDDT